MIAIKEKTMKLYIWQHKECLTFGRDEGIAFAMAESEEKAQDLIMKEYFKGPYEWETDNLNRELRDSAGDETFNQIGKLSFDNWRQWAKTSPEMSFGTCEFILLIEAFDKGAKVIDSNFGAYVMGNDS